MSHQRPMRIQFALSIPPPPRDQHPEATRLPKQTIEEQVRDTIELIESDCPSKVEWHALRGLYADLQKMKPNARIKNLINMIRPVMSKYGYHS